MVFSFFRIHEAIPALTPLRIPNLLAILTFAALAIHFGVWRSVKPFWHPILTVFSLLFLHVTVGLAFAGDRAEALAYWMGTYWKIAVMLFAICWLARTPSDFKATLLFVILSGLLISAITISNGLQGIGLVEGSRVTIGREAGSVLGDPNDLSLVLLFPMAFACSLVVTRGMAPALRAFGILAILMIFIAILFTQSRGGLLGVLSVWAVAANRVIRNKLLLAGLGLFGALVLYEVAGISDRQSGGAQEEGIDESAMGRLHAWGAAWGMAVDNPVFGVGLRNFLLNYYFYSDFWDGKNKEVHSTWLGVLAETGFTGLGLFMAMMISSFVLALRTSWRLERADAPAAARALCFALVGGLTGFMVSGTFLTQGFTWPLYIQVALTVALGHYARKLQDKRDHHRKL
jgi:O-antigen ligase